MKKLFLISLFALIGGLICPYYARAGDATLGAFDSGGLDGWNSGSIIAGNNSSGALRLHNNANDSTGSKKTLNSRILAGYTTLEMDVNLNGATILNGDASGIIFDQGGWKMVSLKDYAQNGQNGWQHVKIPLSNFQGLNTGQGVASMTIRFWNNIATNYDIDNIKLTNSSGNITPPPIDPPTQPVSGNVIAKFDSTTEGFDRGSAVNGTLRLQNPSNGDASTKKIINSQLLKNYKSVEFDLDIHGSYLLDGDAATIAFDQGGTRMVSLKNKVINGKDGIQHVKIAFSEFPGLNPNEGIASISFRFWNYMPGTYDIDNIMLSGDGTVTPPPVNPPVQDLTTPSNLAASVASNQVALNWNGQGQTYIIYRNGTEIARTSQKNYTDTNVSAGTSYQYFVKVTDGSRISNSSNTITANIPAAPLNPPPANTGWEAKSIDSQVMSKYWAISDDNQIRSLVRANKALGAKQIAVSINYNNYSLLKKWADIIHSEGLNVWFRSHWDEWDSWEKPEIKNGITSTEYLNRTYQFILSHPDLFRAGDSFTMCVESENAAWWTGIDQGPFNGWESWRSFTRNQVTMANDAFNRIGLGGKVKTNWINMNGWVAWNALDQQTVNVIGQLTLDHIIDWTDDTGTYVNALFRGNGNGFYGYDEYYNKWKVPMMAGEWGYSTFNQSMDPIHQKELAGAVFSEFAKRSYMVGVNYWIDVGHASRLYDTPNLLDYTRRPISDVIAQYYC